MPDIETTCVRTALISTSTATATTVSSSMPCEPCSSNYLQTVVGNNILGSTNSVYLPYSPLYIRLLVPLMLQTCMLLNVLRILLLLQVHSLVLTVKLMFLIALTQIHFTLNLSRVI